MEQAARAILVFALIFNSSAFGNVVYVHKGDPAPVDGFLFDHDSEAQAEANREDAIYYKALSITQAQKISLLTNESDILDKRLQLYINESTTLAKDRASTGSTEKLYLLGSFALGVMATTLVVRNVRQ